MELSREIRQKIDRYQPIEIEGVTLYPILTGDHRDFYAARGGIAFLQQALPARYISLPLLQAFFQMEQEAAAQGQPRPGLFARCLLFLSLSLRLCPEEEGRARLEPFRLAVNPKGKLEAVLFCQDGVEKRLTPVQFARLRPILAAQNGITLASNDANPELMEAESDLAEANGPKLDWNMEDLICAVAALCGAEEGEIAEWPILKLERRKRSFERILSYLICGVGACSGCSWKGGNPAPSPWFDRVKETFDGVSSLSSFAGGAGMRAMEQAGAI